MAPWSQYATLLHIQQEEGSRLNAKARTWDRGRHSRRRFRLRLDWGRRDLEAPRGRPGGRVQRLPGDARGTEGKVRFVVTNIGTVEHEFVVLKTAKPAGNLLKGKEADESGAVGEIGGVPPGQARTLNLTLKPGHYSLICNLPGHYKTGQFADFYVR